MEFVVKDSGKREEYVTGMRRDTQEGKPRYDLTIPENMKNNMLKRFAVHMAKGAVKYGERNWELASTPEEAKRFKASAFRHFMQWFNGDMDEDHAAAIYFNVQCFEYVKERMKLKHPKCGHLAAEFDYICMRCGDLVKKEKQDGIQESEKRVVPSMVVQSTYGQGKSRSNRKGHSTRKNGKAHRS